MSSTTLKIEIDDPDSYHVGGNALSGRLILTVGSGSSPVTLKEVKLRILCDLDLSMTIMHKLPGMKPEQRAHKFEARVYDGEVDVRLHSNQYDAGTHSIPFQVPLPPELLPSTTATQPPDNYAQLSYHLKAHARRKGGAGRWFGSSSELKAVAPFLYMPVSTITEDDIVRPQFIDEPFNGPAFEGARVNKGLFKSIFHRDQKYDAPLVVKGFFSVPVRGLIPGRPTPLCLRIEPEDGKERIVVKSVVVRLEHVIALSDQKHQAAFRLNSDPILQAMPQRSGTLFDLSDVVSKNAVPSGLAPSFESEFIASRYRLVLELTLLRPHSSTPLSFTHAIGVRVLSPFTKEIPGPPLPLPPSPQHDAKESPSIPPPPPPPESPPPPKTSPRPPQKPSRPSQQYEQPLQQQFDEKSEHPPAYSIDH